jgi:glycosyltransferase involved in cell wall biosynthesis
VLTYLHLGAFSGSALSLRDALSEQTTIRPVDLLPLSRSPALLPARAAAVLEARRAVTPVPAPVPWTKTARWSSALQRRLRRTGVLDPASPLLVVQTLPAFVLDDRYSYAVYTDRVGREGAAVGGAHSSRFTAGWLERESEFLRGAAHVFVMGPSTKRVLTADYGLAADRVTVVGAGPNMRLGGSRHRTACRRLLFVGTQWELKGGPALLEAFAALRLRHPELELILAGSVPPGPLPSGVSCMGRVPPDAMDAVYDRADLLVIPTHMEAFGIALVEGLVKGLPCVCSTVGNQPWIVGDAGRAVPPGDALALAEALADVVRDYPLYQARALRRGDELRQEMRWSTVAGRICAGFLAGAGARA